MMLSPKKCDSLLVESDNFIVLGASLGLMRKGLISSDKEQVSNFTVQLVLFSTMSLFLNLIVLLAVHITHKNLSLQMLHCHFCWLPDKNIFYLNYLVCYSVLFGNIWHSHYSYLLPWSWLSITMIPHLYEDKYFVNF